MVLVPIQFVWNISVLPRPTLEGTYMNLYLLHFCLLLLHSLHCMQSICFIIHKFQHLMSCSFEGIILIVSHLSTAAKSEESRTQHQL